MTQAAQTPSIAATQITMGLGLVDVTDIRHEGRKGILFRPRETHIPIGSDGELPEGKYWPVSGDVVIWIENAEGAQVISDCLAPFLASSQAAQTAETREEPVSARWRLRGNEAWVYDPKPSWLAQLVDDENVEIELLYNRPSLQSAAPAQTAETKHTPGVTVKPLHWPSNWGIIKAETPIGHYFIEARRDGSFDCRLENIWTVWASSEENAKGAAQADFERRALSCLVDPAVGTAASDLLGALRYIAKNWPDSSAAGHARATIAQAEGRP